MEKGALEDKFAFEEFDKLIKKFEIKRIIETGTYLGWSTKKLCEFDVRVDSIEIEKKFYDNAKNYLKNEKLNLHLGDSVKVLKEIIEEDEKNVLIFLDAHWEELPIINELDVIYSKKIKPVIVIHDFFVPDSNGNAKFHYDEYHGVKLNLNLIQNHLDLIYNGGYDYHYNTETDCVNSGLIFIYPK